MWLGEVCFAPIFVSEARMIENLFSTFCCHVKVWGIAGWRAYFWNIWKKFYGHDFSDLIMFLLGKLSSTDLKTWCVMAWMLWYNKSQVVHGKEGKTPWFVFEDAELWLGEYKRLHGSYAPNKWVNRSFEDIWCPPKFGCLKLNVDVALAAGEGLQVAFQYNLNISDVESDA